MSNTFRMLMVSCCVIFSVNSVSGESSAAGSGNAGCLSESSVFDGQSLQQFSAEELKLFYEAKVQRSRILSRRLEEMLSEENIVRLNALERKLGLGHRDVITREMPFEQLLKRLAFIDALNR